MRCALLTFAACAVCPRRLQSSAVDALGEALELAREAWIGFQRALGDAHARTKDAAKLVLLIEEQQRQRPHSGKQPGYR